MDFSPPCFPTLVYVSTHWVYWLGKKRKVQSTAPCSKKASRYWFSRPHPYASFRVDEPPLPRFDGCSKLLAGRCNGAASPPCFGENPRHVEELPGFAGVGGP
ncbi:unnamed protein product [Linum trigynum]|uniref:Uncharacterized protein n=1 Tax=Linum trigynum TaxID=586398 RepID=A0AAV2CQ64_9ROSI